MKRPLEHSQRVIPRGSATKDDPVWGEQNSEGLEPHAEAPRDSSHRMGFGTAGLASQEQVQGWLRLGGCWGDPAAAGHREGAVSRLE